MSEFKNYGYLNMANESRKPIHKREMHPALRLILFNILPFILVNLVIFLLVTAQPDFEVTVDDPGDYQHANVTVLVKSALPKKEFFVLLDTDEIELEQDGKKYTATIDRNGTLTVSMTLFNGMCKTEYENISCIDDAPPIITEADATTGYVSFYVDDTGSGVDYDSIYAVDDDGKEISPSLIDKGEDEVVFNYTTASIEVHVSDKAGHEAIVTFGGNAEEGAAASAPTETISIN